MILSVTKNGLESHTVDFSHEISREQSEAISFFIGRSEECHVVLDDRMVSREAAEIKYENHHWNIYNLSKTSDLVVNNRQVEQHLLQVGDKVQIGSNTIIVKKFDLNDQAAAVSVISDDDQVVNDDQGNNDNEGSEEEDLSLGDEDELGLAENELEDGNIDEFQDELSSEKEEGFDFEADDLSLGEDGDELDDDSGVSFPVDDFGGELDDDGDEGTRIIQSFATIEIEISGEYAPYDKYSVTKDEVLIGRDPAKCDIILLDPEVSAIHARLKKNNITCSLVDNESANGTLLNGERVNSSVLTNDDEFVIGTTTFLVHIKSDFLLQEEKRLMPVDENQVVEVEEIVEVGPEDELDDQFLLEGEGEDGNYVAESNSLFSKDALKNPEKRKKILYILVGLLFLWIMLDEEKKPVGKKPGPDSKSRLLNKETSDADGSVKTLDNKPLTKEQKEFAEATYRLAKELFDVGRYREVLDELAKIHAITSNFKNSKQLEELAQEGLEKLTALNEKKRQEEEKKKRKAKVKELVAKAKLAVTDKKISLAEGLFGEIAKLDPENFDLAQMKLEIDSYKRERDRLALEKAQKEAERKRQFDALTPGKNFYLKKEWYKAISKLEDFLRLEGLDEDLRKEGSEMLADSKTQLKNIIDPLLGRARSLKEGQDLKGAYEIYLEIYEKDPARSVALKEMYEIREKLELRSRKIYRDAIISESLSLFDEAKEKFKEVQQLSPIDSEYYIKATNKLKNYLD